MRGRNTFLSFFVSENASSPSSERGRTASKLCSCNWNKLPSWLEFVFLSEEGQAKEKIKKPTHRSCIVWLSAWYWSLSWRRELCFTAVVNEEQRCDRHCCSSTCMHGRVKSGQQQLRQHKGKMEDVWIVTQIWAHKSTLLAGCIEEPSCDGAGSKISWPGLGDESDLSVPMASFGVTRNGWGSK